MQIRLSKKNEKDIVKIAKANRRTPTAEANLVIEESLNTRKQAVKLAAAIQRHSDEE